MDVSLRSREPGAGEAKGVEGRRAEKLWGHFVRHLQKAGSRPGSHLTGDHWEPELFKRQSVRQLCCCC